MLHMNMQRVYGLQWANDDVIATNGFMPYKEHRVLLGKEPYCTYHVHSNFHRNLSHKLNEFAILPNCTHNIHNICCKSKKCTATK